jgi:hypothetical protein
MVSQEDPTEGSAGHLAKGSKVGGNGNVLTEWQKRLTSPSPRANIRPSLHTLTFHQRTIVAMFNTFSHHGLHALQLVKTVLSQTSPQLTGPSLIPRSSQ